MALSSMGLIGSWCCIWVTNSFRKSSLPRVPLGLPVACVPPVEAVEAVGVDPIVVISCRELGGDVRPLRVGTAIALRLAALRARRRDLERDQVHVLGLERPPQLVAGLREHAR